MSTHRPPLISGRLQSLLDAVEPHTEGTVADYIPALAEADPDRLGVALCTVAGRDYFAGDAETPFTIQSISKPFVYALALQEHGLDAVAAVVGMEPSGESFNELSLEEDSRRPMNPMINAGAIAVNQLINGVDSSVEDRVRIIHDLFNRLAGRALGYDTNVADTELRGADRNLAIAHMLRSHGIIRDAEDAVLSYTHQCAVEVTARDLAVMAATLGNGGVQPRTGERIFSPEVCRLTMSVMSSAGMYDGAGRWMARIGIPAKSGVAGGIIGTLPGRLGIATFSPRLDAEGNSVRGRLLFEKLSDQMGLHLMNQIGVGVHAIRAIRTHGTDTRIVVQGAINFSAAESILDELSRRDFSAGRVILDFSHVVAVDTIGRTLLGDALGSIRERGFTVGIIDPSDAVSGLTLSDGSPAPAYSTGEVIGEDRPPRG